jgi:serine/threonine protein kinase
MAPEVYFIVFLFILFIYFFQAFFGENYTETCDLYSFGMVLWEVFTGTGEIPFDSIVAQNKKKSNREYMNDVMHRDLRPVCASSSFPEDVKTLILKLWDKDPEQRPSFAACCEVLQGVAKVRLDVLCCVVIVTCVVLLRERVVLSC